MNEGSKIRELRKNKGISMKQLGLMIGVSEQAISQYERGLRKIPLENKIKIAKALQVPINDIYTSANETINDKLGDFMNLGERIKKVRTKKKITQKQLAEMIGKNIRTVQKYESGDIEVPLENLFKISEALNIQINELYTPDNKTINDFKQDISSADDQTLIKELTERGYVVSRPLEKNIK